MDERQLRDRVGQGCGIWEISQVVGKRRLCVEARVYNLGLSVKVAATSAQHGVAVAAAITTTAPVASLVGKNDVVLTDSGNAELFVAKLKSEGPLPSI